MDWRYDNRIADLEHDALLKSAVERARLDAMTALCEKMLERLREAGVPAADLARELKKLENPGPRVHA